VLAQARPVRWAQLDLPVQARPVALRSAREQVLRAAAEPRREAAKVPVEHAQ